MADTTTLELTRNLEPSVYDHIDTDVIFDSDADLIADNNTGDALDLNIANNNGSEQQKQQRNLW
jgi:hypothetical protein